MNLINNTVIYANANKVFTGIPQGTVGHILTTDSNQYPIWAADPTNLKVASVQISSDLFTVTGDPIITSGVITLSKSSIGSGSITLSNTPIIQNLILDDIDPQTLLYADINKKLISIAPGQTNEQLIAGNSGSVLWMPKSSVISVTVASATPIFSISNPTVTTSGTISINQTNTPTGSGVLVLDSKPAISNLRVSSLTPKTVLYVDALSKLTSLPAGTAGQVILNSGGGNFAWDSYPILGVTSFNLTSTFFTVSGSPITSTGTITINPSQTPTGSGNIVLANSAQVSGLSISNLSTNTVISANGSNLLTSITPGTTGQVLRGNNQFGPPSLLLQSIDLAVPTFFTKTGGPITSTGTITLSSSTTGTGSIVLQTSPTITTATLDNPRLGNSDLFLREDGPNNAFIEWNAAKDGPDIVGFNRGRLIKGSTSLLEWSTRVRLPQVEPLHYMFLNSAKDIVTRPGLSYQLFQNTGSVPIPNNTDSLLSLMGKTYGGGQGELLQTGDLSEFTNGNNRPMLYVCSFSGGADSGSNIAGVTQLELYIQRGTVVGYRNYLQNTLSGFMEGAVFATGLITNGDVLQFRVKRINNSVGGTRSFNRCRITIITLPLL